MKVKSEKEMKTKSKESKKYIAIVKVGNNIDGSAQCVKYRFDNLLKFTQFLDGNWSEWRWYNVYSNRGTNKEKQLGSFTNKSRPMQRFL